MRYIIILLIISYLIFIWKVNSNPKICGKYISTIDSNLYIEINQDNSFYMSSKYGNGFFGEYILNENEIKLTVVHLDYSTTAEFLNDTLKFKNSNYIKYK